MSVATELAELLGPLVVSTDPDDLDDHAYDMSAAALLTEREASRPFLPHCVVRPRSTEDVAKLLRWADETRTPIVPYGGGSGVSGGIVPDGAVVIDVGQMRRIVDIDDRSMLVTAEAGVTGPDLEDALSAVGLTLGHHPQSFDMATVGGWISTRACGQLSAAYGGIEGLVAGLEAVLPGGTVVRSKAAPRRATGPDVASLLIGAEGTLGIVTAATLRASPAPTARADRALRFAHMADGVAACRALAQSDLRPGLVRLYDADDAAIFFRDHPNPPTGPVLLLSFFGRDAPARADVALHQGQGLAIGDDVVAYWWEHRDDAVGAYRAIMAGTSALGPHGVVDTIELAATWSGLRELYHSTKDALSAMAMIAGCHVSHVYRDGACLYFTVATSCASDEEARATLERWWAAAMDNCLKIGGTISHHHGIGRVKARWLPEELGGWWDVLVGVKKAIDPRGIMNPGALGL